MSCNSIHHVVESLFLFDLFQDFGDELFLFLGEISDRGFEELAFLVLVQVEVRLFYVEATGGRVGSGEGSDDDCVRRSEVRKVVCDSVVYRDEPWRNRSGQTKETRNRKDCERTGILENLFPSFPSSFTVQFKLVESINLYDPDRLGVLSSIPNVLLLLTLKHGSTLLLEPPDHFQRFR